MPRFRVRKRIEKCIENPVQGPSMAGYTLQLFHRDVNITTYAVNDLPIWQAGMAICHPGQHYLCEVMLGIACGSGAVGRILYRKSIPFSDLFLAIPQLFDSPKLARCSKSLMVPLLNWIIPSLHSIT